MDKIEKVIYDARKYYVEYSMANVGNEDMKKTIQSIAICVMFLENSKEEKYVIRDARNMIYDMVKGIKNKEGKKLLKGLLKIVK